MSEAYTNALVNETSPYLLQHAHNPVNWYPWGEEAIEKARREDKPIFLSIGYSACHWCHVMEHESFENEEIAAFLNEHYVSIKVDREERPDLDEIYMQAVFMITQHGGWPMSVFLTPQLKPFFAGTYFPPRDGPRGMGFLSILGRLKDAYDQQRDEIDKNGDELVRLIGQSNELIKAEGQGPELAMLDHAVAALRRNYDSYHGGFGGAPKFPPHMSLNLLLREFDRTGELDMLEMVTGTLNHMMRGGIHDQILGGFARYSVDQQWLVPHFEKMLYDNGQLAERYFEAWQVTKNDDYLRVGRRLLDWVIRDMTDDAGGYYSALDADSEGVEGKFYVWTPDEVNAVLDEDDARLFCEFYDITEAGNFEGKSIPNVVRPLEEFAKARGEDPARLRERLDAACAELEQARQKRVPPGRDDKVLTSWNGLMISGMCRGAQVTGEERYRESARRAADFILSEMRAGEGRLLRAWRQGKAKVPGFIDDYANFCVGLIDLYETTFEPRWLQAATELADRMLEDFYDAENGGFFTTDGRDPSVVVRRKETQDGATPSGNSQATVALLRLAVYLEESRYRDAAMKTIDGMNRYLKELPSAVQHLVCAVSMALGRSREVVVIGEPENEETRAIVDAIHRRYFPSMAMAVAESDGPSADFNRRIALLKDRTAENGRPTIYVCENNACRHPVHTAKEALELLG